MWLSFQELSKRSPARPTLGRLRAPGLLSDQEQSDGPPGGRASRRRRFGTCPRVALDWRQAALPALARESRSSLCREGGGETPISKPESSPPNLFPGWCRNVKTAVRRILQSP